MQANTGRERRRQGRCWRGDARRGGTGRKVFKQNKYCEHNKKILGMLETSLLDVSPHCMPWRQTFQPSLCPALIIGTFALLCNRVSKFFKSNGPCSPLASRLRVLVLFAFQPFSVMLLYQASPVRLFTSPKFNVIWPHRPRISRSVFSEK